MRVVFFSQELCLITFSGLVKYSRNRADDEKIQIKLFFFHNLQTLF